MASPELLRNLYKRIEESCLKVIIQEGGDELDEGIYCEGHCLGPRMAPCIKVCWHDQKPNLALGQSDELYYFPSMQTKKKFKT